MDKKKVLFLRFLNKRRFFYVWEWDFISVFIAIVMGGVIFFAPLFLDYIITLFDTLIGSV